MEEILGTLGMEIKLAGVDTVVAGLQRVQEQSKRATDTAQKSEKAKDDARKATSSADAMLTASQEKWITATREAASADSHRKAAIIAQARARLSGTAADRLAAQFARDAAEAEELKARASARAAWAMREQARAAGMAAEKAQAAATNIQEKLDKEREEAQMRSLTIGAELIKMAAKVSHFSMGAHETEYIARAGLTATMGPETGTRVYEEVNQVAKQSPYAAATFFGAAQGLGGAGMEPDLIASTLNAAADLAAKAGASSDQFATIADALVGLQKSGKVSKEFQSNLGPAGPAIIGMVAKAQRMSVNELLEETTSTDSLFSALRTAGDAPGVKGQQQELQEASFGAQMAQIAKAAQDAYAPTGRILTMVTKALSDVLTFLIGLFEAGNRATGGVLGLIPILFLFGSGIRMISKFGLKLTDILGRVSAWFLRLVGALRAFWLAIIARNMATAGNAAAGLGTAVISGGKAAQVAGGAAGTARAVAGGLGFMTILRAIGGVALLAIKIIAVVAIIIAIITAIAVLANGLYRWFTGQKSFRERLLC